jgi:hypothetical protein
MPGEYIARRVATHFGASTSRRNDEELLVVASCSSLIVCVRGIPYPNFQILKKRTSIFPKPRKFAQSVRHTDTSEEPQNNHPIVNWINKFGKTMTKDSISRT